MARSGATQTFVMAAVTMVAFAANSVLCRAALDLGQGSAAMHPLSFALLRLGAGALVLAPFALRRGPHLSASTSASATAASAPLWATAGSLLLYIVGFSWAYLRLDAGTGAIALFGAVQITMFLAATRDPSGVPPRAWLGMGLAMAALVFMFLPGAGAPDPVAAAAMLAAGVGWGLYSRLGRRSRAPARDNAKAMFVVALLLALAYLAARAKGLPGLELRANASLLEALASGVVATGLGYALWYATLPRLSSSSASVIQLSVPVLAALGGAAWLQEAPSVRVMGATPVVLAGIWLALRTSRPAAASAR